MSRAKRILLGRIVGVHGVRGEVVIKTFTAAPDGIAGYGPLSDASGQHAFRVTSLRVTAKGVVARLAGVGDRTTAERLKGMDLFVDRDRLPPPGEGEYYHEDLIGLTAVDTEGRAIGQVVGVHNFGAGDLLEIARTDSRHTDLVPFQDAYVPTVDLAAGRVTLIMPTVAPDEPGEPGAPAA